MYKVVFQIIFKSILICLFLFYSNFAEKDEQYSDEELGDISKKTNDYLFVEQKISGKYYFTHGVNIGLGYLALIRLFLLKEVGIIIRVVVYLCVNLLVLYLELIKLHFQNPLFVMI